MSWLTRVRNGIPFLPKRQTGDTLWHKCAKCGSMVFTKEWEENLFVCPDRIVFYYTLAAIIYALANMFKFRLTYLCHRLSSYIR